MNFLQAIGYLAEKDGNMVVCTNINLRLKNINGDIKPIGVASRHTEDGIIINDGKDVNLDKLKTHITTWEYYTQPKLKSSLTVKSKRYVIRDKNTKEYYKYIVGGFKLTTDITEVELNNTPPKYLMESLESRFPDKFEIVELDYTQAFEVK